MTHRSVLPSRGARRALLCLLFAAPLLPAQEPPEVAELIRQLRDKSLDAAAREAVVDGLLDAGQLGARQLFHVVRSEFDGLHGDYQRDLVRHLRDFDRRVPKVIRLRQGRPGPRRVDELRDEVRALSRSGDLTKQMVKEQIDPRIHELEELWQVTPAQVFEVDTKLAEQNAALRATIERLALLFDEQERAEAVLFRSDAGGRLLERYELPPDPRGYRADLDREQARLALLGLAANSRDRKILERNAEVAADPANEVTRDEAAGTLEMNRLRLLAGLNALAIDPKLCLAGRLHSQDMVRLKFFSHTSPIEGKESPGKRAALAGTSGGGENIAAGQSTPQGAIRAWWYSPGHHRNMMGGYGRVGLGRHESHWTQMFGG